MVLWACKVCGKVNVTEKAEVMRCESCLSSYVREEPK